MSWIERCLMLKSKKACRPPVFAKICDVTWHGIDSYIFLHTWAKTEDFQTYVFSAPLKMCDFTHFFQNLSRLKLPAPEMCEPDMRPDRCSLLLNYMQYEWSYSFPRSSLTASFCLTNSVFNISENVRSNESFQVHHRGTKRGSSPRFSLPRATSA